MRVLGGDSRNLRLGIMLLAPWCDWDVVGVLSDFPKSEPPERRSMVMRCHVHGNGRQCFIIRSRAKGFTTEFMLRWLFSALTVGPRLPATDAVAVANAAQAHKAGVPDPGAPVFSRHWRPVAIGSSAFLKVFVRPLVA